MARQLGTSFVASQDSLARYTVELSRFGIDGQMDSIDAISLVMNALAESVRAAHIGPVELGKLISNKGQSEAGLFVDLGATEGAAVTASCPRLTSEVKLSVGRSSKALRSAMWTILAVAVVGGLFAANALFPDWDAAPRLATGLLGGAAVGMAVLAVVAKSQLLAGGRSAEVAKSLDAIVQAWVDSDATAKPKRKKRRRKKRRDLASDDM